MSACERCGGEMITLESAGPLGVRTAYDECPECPWISEVRVVRS